jgi:uncharacterized protein YjbI with pentapeptide repeats
LRIFEVKTRLKTALRLVATIALSLSLIIGNFAGETILLGSLGANKAGSAAYAINYDRKNLRQQDFSGQDLTDNDYTRADLTEANLSHTNLAGVRLFTTHLNKADLEGANLTGATLDGATLIRANLKDAVLEGAYVFSADFREANITGTDFTDVLLEPRVNDMLCETASGTNPTTGRKTRETLFCP